MKRNFRTVFLIIMTALMVFSCDMAKEPIFHEISFEGISKESITVKDGANYVVPYDLPNKQGFKLIVSYNDINYVPGDKIKVTEDILFQCYYEPLDYVVRFIGVVRDDESVKGGSEYVIPLDLPEKPGYSILLMIGDRLVAPGQKIQVTGDITISCKYQPNDYTVEYKGIVKDAENVVGGSQFTIPDNLPDKAGYILVITYGDRVVNPGESITVVGDIVLQCEYVKGDYTVSYEGVEYKSEYLKGEAIYTIPSDLPMKPGYDLVIKFGDKTYVPGDEITVVTDIAFKCDYVPCDYTVTYSGVDIPAQDVKGGTLYTVPSDLPARPGYMLVAKNGNTVVKAGDKIRVEGDIVITCTYVPCDFTVSFNGVSRSDVPVKGGSVYIVPSDIASKPGYRLVIMNGKTEVHPGDEIAITGNVVLSCEYIANDYTVTYDGIDMPIQDVKGGTLYTIPNGLPDKPGFHLIIKNGDTIVKPGDKVRVEGNIIILCEYVAGDYTVSFNGVTRPSVGVKGGCSFVVPSDFEVRPGYNLKIKNGNVSVKPGDELKVIENIILVCEYVPGDYTVSYNGIDMPVQDVKGGSLYTVPTDLPEKAGYKLIIMNGKITVKPGDKIRVEGNIVIQCEYIANDYTVSFEGIVRPSVEVKGGTYFTIPDDIAAKPGYRLVIRNGNIEVNPGDKISIIGNVVLSCEYIANDYTVTYEGITVPIANVKGGSVYVIPKDLPETPGYRLELSMGKDTVKEGDELTITDNVVITCKYVACDYTVSYEGIDRVVVPVKGGSVFIVPSDFEVKPGYNLKIKNGNTYVNPGDEISIVGNVILYCEYVAGDYTVTYEGIEVPVEDVKGGSVYSIPADLPGKAGFKLVIKVGNEIVQPGRKIRITDNLVITCIYVPLDFKVSFAGITRVDEPVKGGSEYIVPSNLPAKTGYKLRINNGVNVVVPGDRIPVVGDIILTCSYDPLPYKVSFTGIERLDETVYYDSEYTVPYNLTQRPGYNLVIKNGDTIVKPGDRIKVKGNITLTCSYVAGDYKVSFSGITRTPVDVKGGSEFIIPTDLPEKLGYNLVLTCNGEVVKPGDALMILGNITINCEYCPGEFTVTFNGITRTPEGVSGGDYYVIPSDLPAQSGKRLEVSYKGKIVKPGDKIKVEGNIILDCKWIDVWKITFKGEEITNEPVFIDQGKVFTVPDIARAGYGVYSISDDSGKLYTAGESYELASDINLTWTWSNPIADYVYKEFADYICIEKYEGQDIDVVIPAYINGKKVTELGMASFTWNPAIVTVKIPDNLVSIRQDAFYRCENLKSIFISRSVSEIDLGAFYGCCSLESIVVDDDNPVFYCKDNCLINRQTKTLVQGCKNSIIPEGEVEILGPGCFGHMSGLTSIVIPDSVRIIKYDAFNNCGNLASITFGTGLEEIEGAAFLECRMLTSLTFPDSLRKIGGEAFCMCHRLTDVTFGNHLEHLDMMSFAHCGLTSVVLPDSLVSSADSLFMGCRHLTSVTLGNGLTMIPGECFAGTALTSIAIPDCVTVIGNHAFEGCEGLEIITWGNNVERLGQRVFSNCKSLTSVTIPACVNIVEDLIFDGCDKLMEIKVMQKQEDCIYWKANWKGKCPADPTYLM